MKTPSGGNSLLNLTLKVTKRMKIYSSPGGQGYRVSPEISIGAVCVTGVQFPGRICHRLFFSVSVSAVCVTFQQQELENFKKGSLPEPSHISVGTRGLGKVSTVKFSGAYQTYQLQVKGFAGYLFLKVDFLRVYNAPYVYIFKIHKI